VTGSLRLRIQQGGGNEPVSLRHHKTEWLLSVKEGGDSSFEILFGLGVGSIPSCIHREGEQDHLEDIFPLFTCGRAN
jgi:hypothetical protein